MKKILFVLAFLLTVGVCVSSAQSVTNFSLGDRLTQKIDVLRISNWTPFTSDSLITSRSGVFDIAQYDSLHFWVLSTSANGTPKFSGWVRPSFDGSTFGDSTSIGQCIDTTSTKTELLKYVATLPTNGALKAQISVTGSSVVTANRKDPIVTIFIVGQKRTDSGTR